MVSERLLALLRNDWSSGSESAISEHEEAGQLQCHVPVQHWLVQPALLSDAQGSGKSLCLAEAYRQAKVQPPGVWQQGELEQLGEEHGQG